MTELGKKAGQRWYRTDNPDLNWFRRGRECKSCGHCFVTAEASEALIYELCELRESLADIKKNAQDYIKGSKKAAASLRKLGRSLGVLKALKVYKEERGA
jgi:hypothetical protein